MVIASIFLDPGLIVGIDLIFGGVSMVMLFLSARSGLRGRQRSENAIDALTSF